MQPPIRTFYVTALDLSDLTNGLREGGIPDLSTNEAYVADIRLPEERMYRLEVYEEEIFPPEKEYSADDEVLP